jgi:hypothetical protein
VLFHHQEGVEGPAPGIRLLVSPEQCPPISGKTNPSWQKAEGGSVTQRPLWVGRPGSQPTGGEGHYFGIRPQHGWREPLPLHPVSILLPGPGWP